MPPAKRALAALRANPGASLTDIAKIAKLSRSTVVNAHKELAAEARRKPREACKPATPNTDRRTRAQAFLKDELARGPKKVTDVEEAAAKAHVAQTLEQARADLGIVTTRANAAACRPCSGACRASGPREPMTARVILAGASTH